MKRLPFSDVQLKIWDALEGVCAATLKGHSGGTFFFPILWQNKSTDRIASKIGILGTAMVDRGKNVICMYFEFNLFTKRNVHLIVLHLSQLVREMELQSFGNAPVKRPLECWAEVAGALSIVVICAHKPCQLRATDSQVCDAET